MCLHYTCVYICIPCINNVHPTGVYTDVDDDNMSVLSSDDEEFSVDHLEMADEDQVGSQINTSTLYCSRKRNSSEAVDSSDPTHQVRLL